MENKKRSFHKLCLVGISASLIAATGCIEPPKYSISGTISGLEEFGNSQALKLTVNDGETVTSFTDGYYSFSIPLTEGDGYVVSVSGHPRGIACDITGNYIDTISSDISDMNVDCHEIALSTDIGVAHNLTNYIGDTQLMNCIMASGLGLSYVSDLSILTCPEPGSTTAYIHNLTGIGYLGNLSYLNITVQPNTMNDTNIDLRKLTELTDLQIWNSNLPVTLDLSGNTKLAYLNLSGNKLTSIDISHLLDTLAFVNLAGNCWDTTTLGILEGYAQSGGELSHLLPSNYYYMGVNTPCP